MKEGEDREVVLLDKEARLDFPDEMGQPSSQCTTIMALAGSARQPIFACPKIPLTYSLSTLSGQMPCPSSSPEELAPKPLPQELYLVLRVGEDDVLMGHNFHGTEQVLIYGRLSTLCLLHGNSLGWWLPKLDVLAQLSLEKHRRDSEAGKQFLVLATRFPSKVGGDLEALSKHKCFLN